jgi:hypothetical protein
MSDGDLPVPDPNAISSVEGDGPPLMSSADAPPLMSLADEPPPPDPPTPMAPPPEPAEAPASVSPPASPPPDPEPDDGSPPMTPASGPQLSSQAPPSSPNASMDTDPPPSASNGVSSTEPAESASGDDAPSPDEGTEDIPVWPHSVLPLVAGAYEVNAYKRLPLAPWHTRFIEMEAEVNAQIQGTFTTGDATITSKSSVDNGLVQSFSTEFEWGEDWTVEPEAKFGKPKQKDPEKLEVEVEMSLKLTRSFKSNGLGGEASIELACVAVKFVKEHPDDEWEREYGEIEVTVTGQSDKGTVDVEFDGHKGSFEGVLAVNGVFKAAPDWGSIIKEELIPEWGVQLTCDALVGVAISVGIVAGGIGAIVVACGMIFEAWALEDMANETIPALTDAATQGYMEALKKEAPDGGGGESEAKDVASAHESGVTAGTKKRADVVRDSCGGDESKFDDWLEQNGSAVEAEVRKQLKEKTQKQLWTQKADQYANSWKASLPFSTSATQNDQYHAWSCIIGDCPADKGPEWMKLWLDHRVDDPDHPDRSAGSW